MRPVVDEAAGVARRQVAREGNMLSDVLTRAERTSNHLEQGVARRLCEIQPISAAVRSANTVFLQHPNDSKRRARHSGSLRGWFILLLMLNLTGLFSSRLRARAPASYEGEKVAFVDLVVRPGADVEALRPLILQKAGELYSNEKVQSSVAALKRTGQFSKVEVVVTPEATGLRVAFVMQPAFYIGLISFPGAENVFSYSQLLQAVNYPAESRMKRVESKTPSPPSYTSSPTTAIFWPRYRPKLNLMRHTSWPILSST